MLSAAFVEPASQVVELPELQEPLQFKKEKSVPAFQWEGTAAVYLPAISRENAETLPVNTLAAERNSEPKLDMTTQKSRAEKQTGTNHSACRSARSRTITPQSLEERHAGNQRSHVHQGNPHL